MASIISRVTHSHDFYDLLLSGIPQTGPKTIKLLFDFFFVPLLTCMSHTSSVLVWALWDVLVRESLDGE